MNSTINDDVNSKPLLEKVGFAEDDVDEWLAAVPKLRNDLNSDSALCLKFWDLGQRLRAKLPKRTERSANETAASDLMHRKERDVRERFLSLHIDELYSKLTVARSKFLRLDKLMHEAARLVPGLAPGAEALSAERALPLKEKEGLEIDHGILLSHILAHPESGRHLCHAMLQPCPGTLDLLARLATDGSVDLGAACVSRVGKASVVELRSPKTLNALDETTLAPLETAIDLAILDRDTEIAVLRGGTVEHAKYPGRRVFSAGINLTHLYQGKISFLFYFLHAMGYEHKIFRGIAERDSAPDDLAASTVEKPWIAMVDTFAIGGGCQLLLVMDYVLAEAGAYLTLPARKEGIIPAIANLRLPRFVGDRLARQTIMYGRRIDCDSPEGRLICDEIAPVNKMDAAIAQVVDGLTTSGVVSAVGNRRQFRIGQEPLDLFRRYLALFAKEQAYCHFSERLIANLERNWSGRSRDTGESSPTFSASRSL
jgi:(3,5-dihydroxyphenyl)acetyl-CoA 1,2-dioxygenase